MDLNNKKATRQSYGEAILELGKENKDVVVLDADLAGATKTNMFAKEIPERFFDMGIAEQDMIATAAGMATCGKIPYASTFAVFATVTIITLITVRAECATSTVCYNITACAMHTI